MDSDPETRPSLVLRLREPRDEQAWAEFLDIYEPLIYRLIRRKGLQDADAREVTQEVLLAVAKVVETWEPDPARGSFRGWLFTVVRNLTVNVLIRQKKHPQATGDSRLREMLEEIPAVNSDESSLFDRELKRELFQRAARKIKDEFRETTWRAFWMTCVEGQDIATVADQLGVSTGIVYVSRSRVMARLKKAVQQVRFTND